MMKHFLQRHWPVPVALGVYFVLVGLLFGGCTQPGGIFIYPLDDAYIHLAHGRSLGLHGVWGATSHSFSSSTSSPLWTLLLAGWFWLAGPWELAPLALNLFLGVGLICAMHAWLRGRVRWGLVEAGLLVFFVAVLPMPVMTIIGMEHTLQVLLTVLFVWSYQRHWGFQPSLRDSGVCDAGNPTLKGGAEGKPSLRDYEETDEGVRAPRADLSLPEEAACSTPHSAFRIPHLMALAILLVMSRYEMLFTIAFAGLFLILARRWRDGLLLWVAGWAPVLVYGALSIGHGGWLLPNTLLLKGHVPAGMWATLHRCFAALQVNLSVYALLLLAAAAWAVNNSRPWARRGENSALLLLFIGTAALHTLLAQFGFLFRYEAYLIALGFMALVNFLFTFPFGLAGAPPLQRAWVWGAAAGLGWLALIPFIPRAVDSVRAIPAASRNVYQQQYQMARFLRDGFPGTPVAVNDIGLVCWLADPPLFDAWGLATQAVAKARRAGTYDRAALDALTRAAGVEVAILYEPWFTGKIPESWVKAGQWRIRDNTICAVDTVTFYAVAPRAAGRLAEKLRAYAPRLPRDVLQSGPYLDQ